MDDQEQLNWLLQNLDHWLIIIYLQVARWIIGSPNGKIISAWFFPWRSLPDGWYRLPEGGHQMNGLDGKWWGHHVNGLDYSKLIPPVPFLFAGLKVYSNFLLIKHKLYSYLTCHSSWAGFRWMEIGAFSELAGQMLEVVLIGVWESF